MCRKTSPRAGPRGPKVLPDAIPPASEGDSLPAGAWPLCELPREVRLALAERMHRRHVAPEEVLIVQGEPSRHLFVLVRGVLRVSVQDGQQRHEIARTEGVSVVGEVSLLTGDPCTATVTAATPADVLALSAEQFRALAAEHPVLRSALSALVAGRLGHAPADILTGKVLRGYRVGRCVGRGGMAAVYEAQPPSGSPRVALKMLSHRFLHSPSVQRRFEREMRICRGLEHPNVCKLLDHFTAFGTHVMVMEFCEGQTLAELIRHGPLPEEQVRRIAAQLAAALAYAHGQGVCHRDVKPSNVIVDERLAVKLVDFGLARPLEAADAALTRRGEILGTPRYMAPEQLAGRRVDERGDRFAFGCVVYEMLAGRPLFSANSVLGVLRQQIHWQLPSSEEIRPGLSRDLDALLRRSLALAPAERTIDPGAADA